MTMPTVTVEVALTTDPGDTPAWTDLSSRFISFTSTRGRRDELQRFDPGRARITLSNEDRALDPTYTASPYYPNVVPMRRIRIRATWNAVTYDVFTGYVDDWRQEYMPPQGAVCVVAATDAFKVLANTLTMTSGYAAEVDIDGPAAWFRLGESEETGAAYDHVGAVLALTPTGAPSWAVESLVVGDPDGAISFPNINDGIQGVFPEGTFPFTTAGSLSWLWRVDGAAPGNPPVINIATIPGGTMAGLQTNVDSGTGALTVLLANNAGGTFSVSTTGVNFLDGATHNVVVTWAAGTAIKIYVDGVDRTASAVNFTGSMANTADKWLLVLNAVRLPSPLTPGGSTEFAGSVSTFDELALWPAALTAGRVAAQAAAASTAWAGDLSGERVARILDAADWPAADRDIEAGVSRLQSAVLGGTALSELQRLEETEAGALFVDATGKVRFLGRDSLLQAPYNTSQATFGDSGSELEYARLSYRYDDLLIVNEAVVSREGGATRIVRDATSRTRYLRRSRALSGLLFRYDTDAQDRAEWLVAHYKDPLLRATDMRLEPSAGNETTHFPQALGRELMDRVTVRRKPQNLGSAIDQETMIQGIEHEVTAMEWRTTWNLSPAEVQKYWLAGVAGYSEAGVTTRAGF